ncbi:hypothetical protein JC200_03755 [Alicyclobacillus sp. ALC3]|nr:hypothetical protein JC200_03755 [Alicyclobacillus sp. ALC3]
MRPGSADRLVRLPLGSPAAWFACRLVRLPLGSVAAWFAGPLGSPAAWFGLPLGSPGRLVWRSVTLRVASRFGLLYHIRLIVSFSCPDSARLGCPFGADSVLIRLRRFIVALEFDPTHRSLSTLSA